MLQRLRRFLGDESATSDVEYILISGLVVPPIFLGIPPLLMAANFDLFQRIHIWVNLPFP